MHDGPVIAIDNLGKTFQRHFWTAPRQVLQGLTLSVGNGEIFGFLGPNGAGKTTTIKAIVGLIRPSTGTVQLFARPAHETAVKRRIGFLPETPYFYDYLTGREFLQFCGRIFGLSGARLGERIDGLLQLVGMDGRADDQMRKYSKGMLQRIGLAQALINDPELVVLDEPLTGLDPLGRKEFKDIILELKKQGKTVFFSSHILPDAETMCDRVAIINKGRLLRAGPLHELLQARVKAIELTVAGIDLATYGKLSALALSSRESDHDHVLNYPDQTAVDAAVALVAAAHGTIRSIVPQQESLEEYFTREVAHDA